MKISVIIPTLNEAMNIVSSLDSVKDPIDDYELIVVDGGSHDNTVALASPYASVLSSKQGRATQMNVGAHHATGDVLLFLHADTRLHPNALIFLRQTLITSRVVGGTFTLQFDSDHPFLQLYAFFSRLKFHYFHYGDQGIFVWRSVFIQLGGFASIPIMEDVDFLQRLARIGHVTLIDCPVTTSARRYKENGVVRQQLLNAVLVFAYLSGVKPEKLIRLYRPHQPREWSEG